MQALKRRKQQAPSREEDRYPSEFPHLTIHRDSSMKQLRRALKAAVGTGHRQVWTLEVLFIHCLDGHDSSWLKERLSLLDDFVVNKVDITCHNKQARALRTIFGSLPQAASVRIRSNSVSIGAVDFLVSCKTLESIEFFGVMEPLPCIKVIIPVSTPLLSRLAFYDCFGVSDETIEVLCHGRRIEVIEVFGCKNVIGTFLSSLLEYSEHSLTYVVTRLAMDGVKTLSKFPNLVKADVELAPMSFTCTSCLLPVSIESMKIKGACYENLSFLAVHPTLMKLEVIGSGLTTDQQLALRQLWFGRPILCAGGLWFSG
jgi:hypothetical protein